jgi:hypothetical protein
MIKKISVWIAECDKCKKRFSFSDNEFDCYETKKELLDSMEEGWDAYAWKVTNKKCLCEDCQ